MENSKLETQNSKLIIIIDKIIRSLYYTLFFVTPLVMAPFTSELFEFNKMIFIYFITLGVLFFWLLKMILRRKIIIKKTAFDIPILVFVASQILSTLFSIDRQTSFFGYYGRFNGGLLSVISYVILYYGLVANLPAIRRVLEKILKISLLSSAFVIFWGLPGKFGKDLSCLLFLGQFNNSCWTDQFRPAERMFSTLGQPNWLGAYLAINFFIGMYFYKKSILNQGVPDSSVVQDDKKPALYVYGLYLFVNFSSILFTRSRSALFAVIVGLLMIFLYSIVLIKAKKVPLHPSGVLRLGILFFSLFTSVMLFKTGIQKIDNLLSLSNYYKYLNYTFKVSSGQIQQPKVVKKTVESSSSGISESGDIRKIVWKGAIDLGLKYPFFGTGVETFAYSYYFVRPKEHNLTSEWDFLYNKAHNEFLNYFATTGFIGLGTYLFFIGSVLLLTIFKISNIQYPISKQIPSLKSQNQNSNGTMQQSSNHLLIMCLFCSYLTVLITNFFGFSTTTVNLFFYLIPAFLVVASSNQQQPINPEPASEHHPSWLQKILTLILLSSILYLLSSLFKYYLADIKYAKGDSLSKLGEYQKAAQFLQEASFFRYEHVYEDKQSHILANIAFITAYSKENELAKNLMQSSDTLNLKSISSSPKNVLYWKTRAKNYYLFYQVSLKPNDLDTAIAALQVAKRISPTDPKITYSLAIFYSLLAEETKDVSRKSLLQQRSQSEINEAISLKPDYRDGYFLKGQLLKKAGKIEQARKEFNYILEKLNQNDTEVKKELEAL